MKSVSFFSSIDARHSCPFYIMETHVIPKYLPLLGTHFNGAVRILERATPTVTRDMRLLWSSPRTRDTQTYCRAFYSRAVTTCFYD